jgi:Ca2+-binding EF-hand superfamily protein
MKLVATAVALTILSFGAMAQVDKNKDGKISSAELKACDPNGNQIITKDEAKACGMTDAEFKKYDKDLSGMIEANEMKQIGGD